MTGLLEYDYIQPVMIYFKYMVSLKARLHLKNGFDRMTSLKRAALFLSVVFL